MGATLTIRNDLSKRLEQLAKTTKQSKSSLASQAIEDFLTVQEWHIQAIKEGIEAADKGDFISHEEAFIELKKMGQSCILSGHVRRLKTLKMPEILLL